VSHQRKSYNYFIEGKQSPGITQERIDKLNSIGFGKTIKYKWNDSKLWNPAIWDCLFEHYLEKRKSKSQGAAPLDLQRWVDEQRI